MKKLILLAPMLLLLNCMFTPAKKTVKPAYVVPDDFIGITSLGGVTVAADSVVPDQWWRRLNDDGLNEVVQKVIENNLDLKLAAERVAMVASQFKMSRAQRLPAVSAGGGYSSGEMTQAIPPLGGQPATTMMVDVSQYTLRAGLGFQLDIWGKYRSRSLAAKAELRASLDDLQAAYQGMVAQAIVMYYDLQAARRKAVLADENVAAYETNMAMQDRRYRQGVGSSLALQQTTQALAAAKMQAAGSKMQSQQKEHALAVLMGEYPRSGTDLSSGMIIPELPELPQVLPSTLLKTRPDIRAAEQRLEAARQNVGAARADLFPSVSLSLNISSTAGLIEDLFSENTVTQLLGADIAQVVFAGGAKLAVVSQHKAAYRSAILNYKKTLLAAFKEVEDILVQVRGVDEQKEAVVTQSVAALNVRNEMEQRYLKGLVPYDRFLDAEKALYNAESGRIGMELAALTVRVQFFRAVGAGI